MKPFYAPTENFIKSEKTELAADISTTGVVTASVTNNNNYDADDYCIIEEEGTENGEIVKIQGISGNTVITFADVKLAHKKGAKITKIRYNQRKFYGCATKAGTYVVIGSPATIEVDNPKGTYFEYTGTAYVYFKCTYYNSTTFEESDVDDALPVQAGDVGYYCSVYDIREEAGFQDNPYISDGRIHALRLQTESEVKGSVGSRYTLPLSEIPEVVRLATKLIATGWLLHQEYGTDVEGTAKDGIAKVKEGRSLLKSIRNGGMILLDSDDAELAKTGERGLDGWPDETTKDAEDDDAGGDVNFRISKEF